MSSKPENNRNIHWTDQVSAFRMSCLTSLGRSILPPGYWGDSSTAAGAGKPFGASGNKSGGKLYLTFDDGPNPHTTPHLLSLLAQEKVPATFFLIGQQIERHHQLGRDIVSAGHAVGNHSYNHEFMPSMTLKRVQEAISLTNNLLEEISGGKKQNLFRPPYGILDKRTADCLKEAGMSIVYWTVVPEDWQKVGADRIVERVVRKLADGSIIVLHEGSTIADQTVEATKKIIQQARDWGYEFSPLPDLTQGP